MSRTGERGFTLVELMVALTGGLIFSIFVFGLTANVSRFFQEQTRLAEVTMSAVTGYQRLRADVQRAGFMTSPNFALDPKRCPAPDRQSFATLLDRIPNAIQTAVPQMRRIAVARVETGVAEGVLSVDVITENGLSPDYLYLYGNYTSADSYPSRGFDSGDAFIVLEPTSDELVRGGYIDGASNAQAVLDSLFPAGRLLRVFDPSTGEEQYGLIAGTTATTGAPRVDLNGTVPFAWRDSQPTCGLRGSSSGVRLNTVNIIRYGIADLMGDANYAFLDDGLDFNADRLEFVREEIDPTAEDSVLDGGGGVIAGTTELVAEFAVDFRVDIVAQTSPETAMAPVTTTFIPSATGAFANFAGDPTDVAQAAGVGRGPHLIRALRPRLSVRERIPTKEADLDASAGPGLFRIPLTDLTTTPREYAKVRTLSSYVMTRNARNAQW